jgi:hypothetical protein
VVEGAALEMLCRGNSTEGSNPSLSAINYKLLIINDLQFVVRDSVFARLGKLFSQNVLFCFFLLFLFG